MGKRMTAVERYVELRNELHELKQELGLDSGKNKAAAIEALETEDKRNYLRLQRSYMKAFHAAKWEMKPSKRRMAKKHAKK